MHRPSFTSDLFAHLENLVMAAHADPEEQEGRLLAPYSIIYPVCKNHAFQCASRWNAARHG